MASGRINRNVPCRAGGLGGITPIRVWSLSKSVRRHPSTECHRTTRANIRFHLDGGPQGWNPHFFGPEHTPEDIIKPSSCVRREGLAVWSVWPGVRPQPGIGCVQAEHPVTVKGVGWTRGPARAVCPAPLRITFEEQGELKGVERTPLRHAVTWVCWGSYGSTPILPAVTVSGYSRPRGRKILYRRTVTGMKAASRSINKETADCTVSG